MGRKNQPIKVRAWVHVGDELVNVDDLTPEQKVKLATWLKMTWLNSIYAGQAVFYPADTKDTKEEEDGQNKGEPGRQE